jgi:hypothetical protein
MSAVKYPAQKNANDFLVCLPLKLAIRTHIFDVQTIERFGDDFGYENQGALLHAQRLINPAYRVAGSDVRSLEEIGIKSLRPRKDGLFSFEVAK